MGLFGGKGSENKTDGTYVQMENGLMAEPIHATLVEDDSKKKPTVAAMPEAAATPTDSGLVFITRHPTFVTQCPFCQSINARTRIRTAPGILTFVVSAALLVGIGYFLRMWFIALCVFAIPFCVDVGKTTTHFCMECNRPLGTIGPCTDCCTKNR
jgi:LITAF-like zinc ribbon domain